MDEKRCPMCGVALDNSWRCQKCGERLPPVVTAQVAESPRYFYALVALGSVIFFAVIGGLAVAAAFGNIIWLMLLVLTILLLLFLSAVVVVLIHFIRWMADGAERHPDAP
jgi:hypothetical protein